MVVNKFLMAHHTIYMTFCCCSTDLLHLSKHIISSSIVGDNNKKVPATHKEKAKDTNKSRIRHQF